MTYFLIAGEASGDMHAARLIQELRLRDTNARVVGLGGDQMRQAGCLLYQDYRHMAFMGVWTVLRHLPEVLRNFWIARRVLLSERPACLILVDYPSFNLPIARFVRHHLPDTRIYYYIPPKVWAWKQHRVHALARLCHQIFGIFPFEPAFYQRFGYTCTYVGNPTQNAVQQYLEQHTPVARQPIIAILPGSRLSEVSHCLPTMLSAARRFSDFRLVVAVAPGMDENFYRPYLRPNELLTHDTYDLLARAQAAIVNSGTATLETALLDCPQVAVYHIAAPDWMVRLLRPVVFQIKHFTLVNIIAQHPVIRELLADLFTEENIADELGRLLTDPNYTQEMLAQYASIRSRLTAQQAAATAAQIITC